MTVAGCISPQLAQYIPHVTMWVTFLCQEADPMFTALNPSSATSGRRGRSLSQVPRRKLHGAHADRPSWVPRGRPALTAKCARVSVRRLQDSRPGFQVSQLRPQTPGSGDKQSELCPELLTHWNHAAINDYCRFAQLCFRITCHTVIGS